MHKRPRSLASLRSLKLRIDYTCRTSLASKLACYPATRAVDAQRKPTSRDASAPPSPGALACGATPAESPSPSELRRRLLSALAASERDGAAPVEATPATLVRVGRWMGFGFLKFKWPQPKGAAPAPAERAGGRRARWRCGGGGDAGPGVCCCSLDGLHATV